MIIGWNWNGNEKWMRLRMDDDDDVVNENMWMIQRMDGLQDGSVELDSFQCRVSEPSGKWRRQFVGWFGSDYVTAVCD